MYGARSKGEALADDGHRERKMQMSFTKAIVEYFGKKPGQSTGEFMQEIKNLTPEDRLYFKQEFAKVGIEIIQAI
jgi:hypothetical protein